MNKTLYSIAAWAILAMLLGSWLGSTIGWAVFALGLLLMVLISGMQLQKIRVWVRDLHQAPPVSIGPWDEILAPVYRKLKADREQITSLNRGIEAIMLAAEALPDGALTLDESMGLQWCNQTAAEHLGLNMDTDQHHSIFNILRAPEFTQYVNQNKWDSPLLLHTEQGGLDKSLLIQLSPYGFGQFLLVTRDVTQVEKLETTRKDFVANVSHELRTPLTVLLGFLETLREHPADSFSVEQRERYEQMMLEQAQHMQAIVADLLTLSTLESSPPTEGRPVRVSLIIQHALEQAKALSNGQHHFVENIDPALCIVGSENELTSAISNLLTNAIRYTPKEGTITVSWYSTEDGGACYSVQDTGIGIAPQDIPRLTERFYRADKGRSRATGGTGLGLAITRHVAVRHNAELLIQSQFGTGSMFTLRFAPLRVRTL
ncbi:phosphate regulon sensor histidine kinase PhoR [Paenalcaligenes suwonensis]|uniref:phosphate regulon sensor histidine kinase PhoR n=1 Tax=Paenalcaligenes suwonensis TaxID=1202713 RepID=UPI00140B4339|nr:phosphate regulon sensor histidine kinase PhoR [Paenalcaligenes suwonensis]NHC60816.1 phosphate regulon sensor histidine kinase PhoR [Paenalcaligenes suwonensis]